MSLASNARVSSALTAQAYELVAAERVELLPTGFHAVVGACGHRLTVVNSRDAVKWEEKIEAKSRHRRRCESCVKDPEAHLAKLVLG